MGLKEFICLKVSQFTETQIRVCGKESKNFSKEMMISPEEKVN